MLNKLTMERGARRGVTRAALKWMRTDVMSGKDYK